MLVVSNLNVAALNGAAYTSGTWTPTIIGVFGTAGVTAYTTQTGTYTQIGNIVYAYFKLVWTTTTATGYLGLAGFPFAAGTGPSFANCQTLGIALNTTYKQFQIVLGGGSIAFLGFIVFYILESPAFTAGNATLIYGPFANGTIECSIVYSRV